MKISSALRWVNVWEVLRFLYIRNSTIYFLGILAWCEWRRSSAWFTTAWKKSSLKTAPQSHETELWLWRRRARKKEKKGSITIYEGKSQVQEEGGRKKRRKGMVLNWLHKASLQRTYMKRNDLLLASPFLKYSAFSIYEIVHQAVENQKVFDEENKSQNSEKFSKKRDSKTSTWVTYQILTKGWEVPKRIVWLKQTLFI